MTSTNIRWTNSSVKTFASGGRDPVELMESRARALTLLAMDKGWGGPPYNPIRLAELLGYEIEARDDIKEARVCFQQNGKFKIEFNPTRTQGRIYFSVAHEIAHTLFPDCKERIRHRGVHEELGSDDWQIEMLCNVGAAELLMPVGSFNTLRNITVSIEDLLKKQKDLQVSTEALLIRYAKLADSPCAAFCASRAESGRHEGRYRLDYLIPSKNWKSRISAGTFFGEHSPVNECVAIGYTAKGKDTNLDGASLLVEAVGLPPYPGRLAPRVAGLVREPKQAQLTSGASINYVRGDALAPRGTGKKIIAHVINDKTTNWGGGGFAAAAKRRWPDAHRTFVDKVMESDRKLLKLGAVTAVAISEDVTLFNVVAQYGYGPSPTPRIRYEALRSGLETLSKTAKEQRASVHMPRIGTGNARGSWDVIEEMIDEVLVAHDVAVTVYDLPQ